MSTEDTVKKKAKNKGYTMKQIAEELNIKQQTLSNRLKNDQLTHRDKVKLIDLGLL